MVAGSALLGVVQINTRLIGIKEKRVASTDTARLLCSSCIAVYVLNRSIDPQSSNNIQIGTILMASGVTGSGAEAELVPTLLLAVTEQE